MIFYLLVNIVLIAVAFALFWKFFGGRELYHKLTYDEADDLQHKIVALEDKLAELPSAEASGEIATTVDFLREEFERDRNKLRQQLDRLHNSSIRTKENR